jgi:ABC-type antimicrobial peptide transport system permease subunit
MSYNIGRRRNEIGVRMAVGAEQFHVLRMMPGEVAIFIVAGIAPGLVGAISGTRFLASFLYGVKPIDLTTPAAACMIPAAAGVIYRSRLGQVSAAAKDWGRISGIRTLKRADGGCRSMSSLSTMRTLTPRAAGIRLRYLM